VKCFFCGLCTEENNLVGTIPTEAGLLSDLAIWGMERGGLTGPIPSEIGNLSALIFFDLDFNDLSGTLPTELFLLTGLTQFDVNNNRLSGNIDQMGIFEQLDFLQIHANLFTYVSIFVSFSHSMILFLPHCLLSSQRRNPSIDWGLDALDNVYIA
jgi:Leucine-rich repeat (LRR) protein